MSQASRSSVCRTAVVLAIALALVVPAAGCVTVNASPPSKPAAETPKPVEGAAFKGKSVV